MEEPSEDLYVPEALLETRVRGLKKGLAERSVQCDFVSRFDGFSVVGPLTLAEVSG